MVLLALILEQNHNTSEDSLTFLCSLFFILLLVFDTPDDFHAESEIHFRAFYFENTKKVKNWNERYILRLCVK